MADYTFDDEGNPVKRIIESYNDQFAEEEDVDADFWRERGRFWRHFVPSIGDAAVEYSQSVQRYRGCGVVSVHYSAEKSNYSCIKLVRLVSPFNPFNGELSFVMAALTQRPNEKSISLVKAL